MLASTIYSTSRRAKMKVFLHGRSGKMGQALVKAIAEYDNFEEAYSPSESDLIIDFTSPEGLVKAASVALLEKKPLLSGTTGLEKKHLDSLKLTSVSVPVLVASNFSFGIFLLRRFLQESLDVFSPKKIFCSEAHIDTKKDSPSGTTRDLLPLLEQYDVEVFSKRTPFFNCSHSLELQTATESLTITHEGKDRAVYAHGALKAAYFLQQKKFGLYSADEMFEEELKETLEQKHLKQ